MQTDDVLHSESASKPNYKCGEYEIIVEENQPVLIGNERSSEIFLESSLTLSNEKNYFSNRISNFKICNLDAENLHIFFDFFMN